MTRGQRGSTAPLVVGCAAVVLLLVAVVVDASAAYLARQRLAALADGAALQGADLGAQGADAYAGGLATGGLAISRAEAEAAVRAYLRDSGAAAAHPGLRATVRVDGDRLVVELVAPVALPLRLPGAPAGPTVRAVGSAVVDPELG
ncbi:pilus assembly protein TadG-related protein [Nocardioides nitrophenolicus]|uniref:pilus assembly protein TadG-related protein n=1 Tax=Nocardioides nitrophenolicus TaxID=60489 RepID=UPI00195D47DA|nr:pilus assembly protein TadG-related protein [Nocardioides nitrophenolicus]MBM7516013.1 putative membrane protein [Nocardioides nitrophenolicus]